MKRKITVIKASGEKVYFDENKLISSLNNVGASTNTINKILKYIYSSMYDEISTHEIYDKAFHYLKIMKDASASRYKLKQSLMELGPSGYPFEKFVSFIFKNKNYETNTNVFLSGKCITHEMDIVAENDEKIIFVECKYKNSNSSRVNVHVPLYIYSRFLDIKDYLENDEKYMHKKKEMWIITNTKFSEDAIKYSRCGSIKLLGWNYPENKSLKTWIEESNLHPITCLTTLSSEDKKELISRNIVACRELHNNRELLSKTSISNRKHKDILDEVDFLISSSI